MKPTKVSRTHVSFPRYWTAKFGEENKSPRYSSDLIRSVMLIQGFESQKEAQTAASELRTKYENWRDVVVVDLAEMNLSPGAHDSDVTKADAHREEYARAAGLK